MTEDQQDTGLADGRDNVMERALGTFDSLYDDAIAFVIDLTGAIGRTGGDILGKYGNGSDISAALADGLDALARLAAGLFGG